MGEEKNKSWNGSKNKITYIRIEKAFPTCILRILLVNIFIIFQSIKNPFEIFFFDIRTPLNPLINM